MIIRQSRYEDAVDNYMGWCTICQDFTRDMTELDAEEYDCPECGENSVMGAEQAMISGEIEIGTPKSILSKYMPKDRKRNMSPTVKIPVAARSPHEMVEKACTKVDEAISKLETSLRFFKMAKYQGLSYSVTREISTLEHIIESLKGTFYYDED